MESCHRSGVHQPILKRFFGSLDAKKAVCYLNTILEGDIIKTTKKIFSLFAEINDKI